MGMYNSIYVYCPCCGEEMEFQSKSGSCELDEYRIYNMPQEDLKGIIGDSWQCTCGHLIEIVDGKINAQNLVK